MAEAECISCVVKTAVLPGNGRCTVCVHVALVAYYCVELSRLYIESPSVPMATPCTTLPWKQLLDVPST